MSPKCKNENCPLDAKDPWVYCSPKCAPLASLWGDLKRPGARGPDKKPRAAPRTKIWIDQVRAAKHGDSILVDSQAEANRLRHAGEIEGVTVVSRKQKNGEKIRVWFLRDTDES